MPWSFTNIMFVFILSGIPRVLSPLTTCTTPPPPFLPLHSSLFDTLITEHDTQFIFSVKPWSIGKIWIARVKGKRYSKQEESYNKKQVMSINIMWVGGGWSSYGKVRLENSFPLVIIFVVVQLLSRVWLFVTPFTAACQASLSFIVSQSLFKLLFIE